MSPNVTHIPRPLVEVENLQVAFGAHGPTVVKGVSFAVNRGECLALIGESGSGKSVTSRTLVGLTGQGSRVSADRLRFGGEDLLDASERTKCRLNARISTEGLTQRANHQEHQQDKC